MTKSLVDDTVRDAISEGMIPGRIALWMIHEVLLDRPEFMRGAAVIPHPVYGWTQPKVIFPN